jgi:hypothetical protein
MGVVFGEVIAGVDYLNDISAGFYNFMGGRCLPREDELNKARGSAKDEMCECANGIKTLFYNCAKKYYFLNKESIIFASTFRKLEGTAVRLLAGIPKGIPVFFMDRCRKYCLRCKSRLRLFAH